MHDILILLIGIAERGFIFSLIIMGMFLTSRILKFDDLTIEGSFGVGGALTAALLKLHISPVTSTLSAMLIGGIAGLCTALLHTKFKLNNLMSGIIITTALFSVSLKLASANVSLGSLTIFHSLPAFPLSTCIVLASVSITSLYALHWFLQTEIGFMVRATGANPIMISLLGKKVDTYIIIGLVLANMLNALAGSLFVQYLGFFSIWNNIGILIIAFAGLILAETWSKHLGINLLLGSILYQMIITTTFELQLDQDWNKMVTALLILSLILWKQLTTKKEQ